MTRAEAVAELAKRWGGTAFQMAITATDDAAGWGIAVDDALRAMGVAFASLGTATVAVADEADFLALLNYYGVRRLHAEAVHWVSMSAGSAGISAQYSDMAKSLEGLLAEYGGALPDAYAVGGMVVYAQTVARDPDPYAVEEVTA